MLEKLVQAFKALPRRERAPSGLVPNKWHFDVRFIPFNPPSDLLTIIQPQSSFVHAERLPLSGLNTEYFPETPKDAAPVIAEALMHAFMDNMGLNVQVKNPPPPLAPWSFTIQYEELTNAVSDEFKRLSIKAPELLNVATATSSTVKIAEKVFDDIFKKIIISMQLEPIVSNSISTPVSIAFHIKSRLTMSPAKAEEDKDRYLDPLEYTIAARPANWTIGLTTNDIAALGLNRLGSLRKRQHLSGIRTSSTSTPLELMALSRLAINSSTMTATFMREVRDRVEMLHRERISQVTPDLNDLVQ